MNIKQKAKTLLLGLTIMVGFAVMFGVAPQVGAAETTNNGCETDTAIIKCDNVKVGDDGIENTGVWSILLTAINLLTGGIGIVAVAGVVYASIMYASAGGNAEQTKKAMGIITNIVIGVLAYALMFALLNFLIPGGLF